MDGDMWWGWGHVPGCGGMCQAVGNVAGVVIGCGGMWRGWGYVVGVRPMAWMGTCGGVGACGRGWGHVPGCGECGRGGDRVWGHVAGVGVCGRGQAYGINGNMWWGGGMW